MPRARKAAPVSARRGPYKRPTPQEIYPNQGEWRAQKSYKGCDCQGNCLSSTCTCLKDGVHCRGSCGCPADCQHRLSPCKCRKCDAHCPCLRAAHPCTDKCGRHEGQPRCSLATCSNVHEGRKPAKFTLKKSGLLGAGKGFWAAEDIRKGQYIARLKGKVIKDQHREHDSGAMDLFELCQGHSLRIEQVGAYFVNEKPANKANAAFFYSEGSKRRDILLRAAKQIKAGEEVFAPYGAKQFFPNQGDIPRVGSYIIVNGWGKKSSVEQWLGQVTRVNSDIEWHVKWLLRREDLAWLPPRFRKIKLEPGEHIMLEGDEQDVSIADLVCTVAVRESRPGGKLHSNRFWWTKRFDVRNERWTNKH